MPNVLIPIADGSEDLEAVSIIDILRRAGFIVTVASVKSDEKMVTCARGTRIQADFLISNQQILDTSWDAIVLPGGMPGAKHLSESNVLIELLRRQNRQHKIVAAICASPVVVLEAKGLIGGRDATCFDGMDDDLMTFKRGDVVVDRELITSRGPATAIPFALEIVQQLGGSILRDRIAKDLLWD